MSNSLMLTWDKTWLQHHMPGWLSKKVRDWAQKQKIWQPGFRAAGYFPSGLLDHWGSIDTGKETRVFISQPSGNQDETAKQFAEAIGCQVTINEVAPWGPACRMYQFFLGTESKAWVALEQEVKGLSKKLVAEVKGREWPQCDKSNPEDVPFLDKISEAKALVTTAQNISPKEDWGCRGQVVADIYWDALCEFAERGLLNDLGLEIAQTAARLPHHGFFESLKSKQETVMEQLDEACKASKEQMEKLRRLISGDPADWWKD